MIATKIAVALGIVLLGVACWMAAIGVRAASEGLITLFALVVLVGGGNYLAGRSRSRQSPVAPVTPAPTTPASFPVAPAAPAPVTHSADPGPDPATPATEASGSLPAPGPHGTAGEP